MTHLLALCGRPPGSAGGQQKSDRYRGPLRKRVKVSRQCTQNRNPAWTKRKAQIIRNGRAKTVSYSSLNATGGPCTRGFGGHGIQWIGRGRSTGMAFYSHEGSPRVVVNPKTTSAACGSSCRAGNHLAVKSANRTCDLYGADTGFKEIDPPLSSSVADCDWETAIAGMWPEPSQNAIRIAGG
jgi:hypothetical protein